MENRTAMLLLIQPVCSPPTLYRYGCVCMGLQHVPLAIAAAGHSKVSSCHASLTQCVSWASEWQSASDLPNAACVVRGCVQDTAGHDMHLEVGQHEPGQHAEGADELQQVLDEEVRWCTTACLLLQPLPGKTSEGRILSKAGQATPCSCVILHCTVNELAAVSLTL